ncbi:hypothetical protein [Marinobacter mobilis]|uniref:SPOR domain-containing protein n=1 Tax=Marinobacter mobilis TaxID=488533 RepID=A0A1H3EC09_9GAMM|nr:hypothetical protein [Marinobacter mobilis]SDX75798.1 hypothetical protein SAMN04487960_1209 [Marinobacter mobilis]
MKRLAMVLLALNLGLWVYSSVLLPEGVRTSRQGGEDGRLPRVAELELLSGSADLGEPPEQVAEAVGGTGSSELYCVRLGWFETAEEAGSAVAFLPKPHAESAAVIEVARELPPFHWVIIPPSPGREEAVQLLYDIQRRGIDSYLVTEGAQENAISLGLFESREAAEQVLAQRNAENLHAVLALFPRNHLSYALVFEAAYVPGSQEHLADRADFSARFESVEINGCESVATLKKTP